MNTTWLFWLSGDWKETEMDEMVVTVSDKNGIVFNMFSVPIPEGVSPEETGNEIQAAVEAKLEIREG